jgi:glycosyltransferase involved in cell wall biosynthesis
MGSVCQSARSIAKVKRILIISYFFPPMGGVGVQRVLKFVKYLPAFGWQPAVLTLKNPDFEIFDRELAEQIPVQTSIIRTHAIEPSKLHHRLVSLVNKLRDSRKTRKPTGKIEFDNTPRDRLDTRINNFLFIPDNRIGWLPFASLAMLLKKYRGEKFDMIFSTSPPFSVHLVGLMAKLIFRRPWVVDFRDMWTLHPHTKPPTKIHLKISRCIEHKVLRFADKILNVSEPQSEDMRKAYPDIGSERFEVIPNGYDSDDFRTNDDARQGEGFSLGHVGTLGMHSGRTPYYFLKALADLKRESPEKVRDMSIFFVGGMDRSNKEFVDRMTQEFDLKDTIHCIGFVSHARAIDYIQSFSALLFLIVRSAKVGGNTGGSISGKLFEYLATGKPILALTEEGPVRDFIEKSGCAIVADHDDIEGIKEKIVACYSKFREGRLEVEPNWDFISRFERKKLTGQLAKILDDLSEKALK